MFSYAGSMGESCTYEFDISGGADAGKGGVPFFGGGGRMVLQGEVDDFPVGGFTCGFEHAVILVFS